MVTLISWVKTDNDMCIYLRKTLSLSTYLQNMNVIVQEVKQIHVKRRRKEKHIKILLESWHAHV